MDTTDPDITFDENGICNHCTNAIKVISQPPFALSPEEKNEALEKLISEIKHAGEGKKHDCVIGLSGGVDSSYLAYLVKNWGLRPLAIHVDNGWNSDLSVKNIENLCRLLNVDSLNIKLNEDEFKDLQLAFLKASTPDSEIPTDNVILKTLYKTCKEHGIKYILSGVNKSSESILPTAWSVGHKDKKYIKAIYKRFGSRKKLTIPLLSIYQMKFYYGLLKRIKWIDTLDYIDYDKEKAKEFLLKELEWQDYGRKHGESIYTKIYQEYILPKKFGYDKRRAHLSSIIVANQLTREQALEKMKEPLYINKDELENDIILLCKKFNISHSEFEEIMKLPQKTIRDYPSTTFSFIFRTRRRIRKILTH